jgi:hypothetical protein
MNPLQIEREYEALRRHLALVASPRMRMSLISGFLSPLVSSSHNVASAYLYEFLPEWCRLATKTSLLGTPLDFVDSTIALTQKLRDAHAHDSDIEAALANLTRERSVIQEALARRNQNRSYLDQGAEFACVPLVESERFKSQSDPQFARIVRLSVEIRPGLQKGMADNFNVRSLAGNVQGDGSHQMDVLKAARDTLTRLGGREPGSALRVDVDIDGPGSMTGSSSGLAIGLLIVAKLLRMQQSRNEFRASSSTAYTGGLAETGEVLAVDPGGLNRKIECCYFSEIRTLVLPEAQVSEARQHADALQHNSPVDSRLEILGIAHLDDLFHDRRMSVQKSISMSRRVLRRTWSHRRAIALGVLVVLCLTIARLLYGPLDKVPASAVIEGSFLMVKNARGEFLDSVRVNAFRSAYKRDFFKGREGGRGLKVFGDVDGDGRTEVIWGDDAHPDDRGLSMICCRTVGGKGVEWSTDLRQFNPDFPEHPETKANCLAVQEFFCVDADNDGNKEIFAYANQHYFPSLIVRLDAKTGRPEGCYVHAGSFADLTALDVNGDGRLEILAAGVNQGFKNAILVVLDPRRMSGSAPTTDRYRTSGMNIAQHVAYVSFPRSIVGETASAEKSNCAMALHTNSLDSLLTVAVADAFVSTPQGEDVTASLEFGFDSHLRCIFVGSQSAYDRLAEQLYAKRQIPALPDRRYFDGLGERVGYWDGQRFSAGPIP